MLSEFVSDKSKLITKSRLVRMSLVPLITLPLLACQPIQPQRINEAPKPATPTSVPKKPEASFFNIEDANINTKRNYGSAEYKTTETGLLISGVYTITINSGILSTKPTIQEIYESSDDHAIATLFGYDNATRGLNIGIIAGNYRETQGPRTRKEMFIPDLNINERHVLVAALKDSLLQKVSFDGIEIEARDHKPAPVLPSGRSA